MLHDWGAGERAQRVEALATKLDGPKVDPESHEGKTGWLWIAYIPPPGDPLINTHLREVLSVCSLQGLVGCFQELLRALQGPCTGS